LKHTRELNPLWYAEVPSYDYQISFVDKAKDFQNFVIDRKRRYDLEAPFLAKSRIFLGDPFEETIPVTLRMSIIA